MRHVLRINDWHPQKLNALGNNCWKKVGRLKKADRQIVALEAFNQRIPKATGKRRLTFTIVLEPKQRAGDPDAYLKSLNDALKQAGLLVDDNFNGVELMPMKKERGEHKATIIELEDITAL